LTAAKEQKQPGALVWRYSDDPAVLEEERRRSSGWRPDNLRKGFTPGTVIDIGAAHGTPSLYEAFPDSYHVLVEPLAEYEESLRRWSSRIKGEYLLVAIGEEEGTLTINVDPEKLWRSSVLEPLHPSPGDAQREISVTTLDTLRKRGSWQPPFGLKIDTEGFEHKVILGAKELLKETQFVIAEVSVAQRHKGGYSFAEFISLMDSLGFAVCDILDGMKPWQAGQVVFVDALFERVRPA